MNYDDTELIQLTLEGDDDAFSKLVEKYRKQVHALAWRYICDFHIAEEITQDAFLKAYMRLKTLKDPQRFAGWMYVITRRCCLAWLRKKRIQTQSFEEMEQADNEKIEETIYSEYVVTEKEQSAVETQRYVVKKLLAKLQESDRTVVTLHYFGEMSCTEISEFLGVSANTIKSRLRRARQRLMKHEPFIREALENYKITPNLTENIMREIAKADPIVSPTSKPFVPWLVAASTFVVVLIMLGIGSNKNLSLFQQPYSLDASSEVSVEIVEAPVIDKLVLESNVHQQVENNNRQPDIPVPKLQQDNTQLLSTETGEENKMENYPQWHLPKEAKMRLGKGGIWGMQFSPDSTQITVGSSIGVWHYDVKTGEEISLIPNMYGIFAYSPDGRFIASRGGDPITSFGGSHLEKGVVLWNIATASEVSVKEVLPAAKVIRFSNDSKTLVFLSMARDTIYRVNVETGETTTTKLGERPGYLHLENYALAEDKIAIGSDDGRIELWDTRTGIKLSTLREFGKEIRMPDYFVRNNHALTMKFTPDGTRLATGNLDTTVQLWDTSTGEELIVYQKPIVEGKTWRVSTENGKEIVNNPMKNERNGRPVVLAFSPDATLLACGSEDSTIKLWNTLTGKMIATFTGHFSKVGSLVFSPDGNTLVSGGTEGAIRFWDIKKRKPLQKRISGHMWMRTASILNDGSKLVSVSEHGIITVWDLKNSQKTTSITKTMLEEPLYWRWYRRVVLSPDGTILAAHGTQRNSTKPDFNRRVLRLSEVSTGRELKVLPSGYCEVFSPDGKTLISSSGNKIRLLNIETGAEREIVTSEHDEDSDDHKPLIRTVAFSPDGEKIVSGTMGGRVQLWDVETGAELSSFFEEIPPKDNSYRDSNPIFNLAFSSDSSLIAVGSNKRLRLIGRAKQPHFREVTFDNKSSCDKCIFSPDNTILIVGFWGGNIELWDVHTGDLLSTLEGHSVSVEDLSFSDDNKTLISVGGGTILFWDWEKVLTNIHEENQSPETVLQFLEHSTDKPKISDHILTNGEVYLANEWFEDAFIEFIKYLSAADYQSDEIVTTSPVFQYELFTKIGKVGKNIQDKEGFANMMDKLIDHFSHSLSIRINAHLVLADFYHQQGMHQKVEEHTREVDSITVDLSAESTTFQIDVYLSMAVYYHKKGMVEKSDEYIRKIDSIIHNLTPEQQRSTNFVLAEFYRVYRNSGNDSGMKVNAYIQKTGFIPKDSWMILGPFDNAGRIGFDTVYIPEDITEIDLDAKYDGLNEKVSWQKCTDDSLNGYIGFGKDVFWCVAYAFATLTSPDNREAQIRFDSDDQGKVWLNGEEVFTHTKTHSAEIDRYGIPITLKQGKNSILVKVCQEAGGWGFYLRITDQNGQPFDDLKINRKMQD